MASVADLFDMLSSLQLFAVGETRVTAGRLLGLVLIIVLSWWVAYALERGLARVAAMHARAGMSQSAMYALGRIARYLVWIVGSLLGLSYIGFDLSSLAIIGGALGVGIGFGLQNIFSNLISGVIILLEKTLKVGDFVDLQSGVVGRVAEINMRYTRITTNDAVDIIVPNSEFINGRVINWTYGELVRRLHVPFGVAYGSDKVRVRDAALAAAAQVPATVRDDTRHPEVWLVGFGDSSLDFELVVWVGEAGVISPARTQAAFLWALETELKRSGIEIPFPQRDLNFRGGRVEVSLAPAVSVPVADGAGGVV
ncbi:MAG: mechanosensitive ion channel [Gammaproteobacteria bacterium]|jgi:small-conductance mechanosensitive channel|nr:mechanosensitive ion channel [Gammaproteobacteria bacterium]MBU0772059.1 mechanosensitive ion channel [Gammaproteobacteria bacterium]MBU0856392.1 mechanosensitive ion channel [Gammaproteobacteria bacterium]MBU1845850.1 mechanosensitive ion channel [Gammaproteobacteria bacterium]